MKRTVILGANLITQCVLPQRSVLALHYLLSTHSPLTCLGQDLSINGCLTTLTVLWYAVGLMGVEWKICL